MSKSFRTILACAAALTATTALAQTPSGNIQKQTYDFVSNYAQASYKIDQIPRWNDPVCVDVSGLPFDSAVQVKKRVEEVAKAVGARVLPAGCTANVQVIFTGQPQKYLDDIAANRPGLLGFERREFNVLKTVTQPVQSWYVTASIGHGGKAGAAFSNNDDTPGGVTGQTGSGVLDSPNSMAPTGCADNHFTNCLQSVFFNSLVVVDMTKVGNTNVGVMSDYVAMLALSQPRALGTCAALPSITDLFVKGCTGKVAPDGLTAADAAYLTALYQADMEKTKGGEESDIAGRMAKMLSTSTASR